MISNSDDESDSDISLGDAEILLRGRQATEASAPPPEPELPVTGQSMTLRSANRKGQRATTKGAGAQPKKPPGPSKYVFSLEALVVQAERDRAAEAGAARARELAESLDQERIAIESKSSHRHAEAVPNEDLLAMIVGDDGGTEDVDKLRGAISRTEALRGHKTWSFFGPTTQATGFQQRDFPVLPDSAFRGMLSSQ